MKTKRLRRQVLIVRSLLDRLAHNWPVKVLSVVLAVLLFLFHRISNLEERYFSVPLEVRVSDTFVPASSYQRNARVTIRGDREVIFNILEEDIEVYADFTQYDSEGIFKTPLDYHKTGTALGVDYLEISLEPTELRLEIQEKQTKQVDIIPDILGYPARGFELGQYYLTPEKLTITGPRSQIENLRSLMTEPVDLSNLRDSLSLRVGLVVPSEYQLSFPEGRNIDFRGIIQETLLIRTFSDIQVNPVNLAAGLELITELPMGSIKLQGSQLLLESTSASDFTLSIDCSTIENPGYYRLPIAASAPNDFLVLQHNPDEAVIQVRQGTDQ